MTTRADRPIGPPVPPGEAKYPERKVFKGSYVTLEPLDPSHADDLFPLVSGDENAYLWDYMPTTGPFSTSDKAKFVEVIEEQSQTKDPFFWAVVDPKTNRPLGCISFLRIFAPHRTIEIGNILFTKPLQRTRAATEAVFLLAAYSFELGFRRFEWKCHNLNAPSKRAAERYGFTFEGVFRKHIIAKGHSRDTAWFSIIDDEWPERRRAFEQWLDPQNFDEHGQQKKKFEEFR